MVSYALSQHSSSLFVGGASLDFNFAEQRGSWVSSGCEWARRSEKED